MEYSVQAYLRRVPTEKLEKFVQDYQNALLNEDFSGVIDDVVRELARRKGESRSSL